MGSLEHFREFKGKASCGIPFSTSMIVKRRVFIGIFSYMNTRFYGKCGYHIPDPCDLMGEGKSKLPVVVKQRGLPKTT